MRLIVLQACEGVAALLFIIMLVAGAVHCARHGSDRAGRAAALAECLWSVIPWAIVVAAALPAVQLILAER